jgi:hypothetical protein
MFVFEKQQEVKIMTDSFGGQIKFANFESTICNNRGSFLVF